MANGYRTPAVLFSDKATFKLKPGLCRDEIYQCAVAIYQVRPDSALFKLPAFVWADVQKWMKTTFPTELCVLQAAAGNPMDMARIADAVLRVRFPVCTEFQILTKRRDDGPERSGGPRDHENARTTMTQQ